MFMQCALAMLSMAHGQSATDASACGWYSAGTINFPKGNNSNAFSDVNDASVTFTSDGFGSGNSAQTGSASNIAKPAHNRQTYGLVDLNGNVYEVRLGMASDGTNYYVLKTHARMQSTHSRQKLDRKNAASG